MKYLLANSYQKKLNKNYKKFIKCKNDDRNISNTPKVRTVARKSQHSCHNIKGIMYIL